MKILVLVTILIFVFFTYYLLNLRANIIISKKIVASTKSFKIVGNDKKVSVLVLGDSTAVGVGASKPEDSIPGLFAKKVGATYLENYAVSGKEVNDLPVQISKAELKKYDYILVQIGGNDIVARHDSKETIDNLIKILKTLPEHEKLVVICCGNVGAADILPWFVRPYYRGLTLQYHANLIQAVPSVGGVYVDLYDDKSIDPFIIDPARYLAKDKFHPSGEGYMVWFKKIEKVL